MRRFIFLTFLLFVSFGAFAQSISVESFKPLTMDMTASSIDGKRFDQNGQVAALIKVVTTQTGFTFEGGTLGIVDTQQRNGEIWVWVPRGLRKITILHQQLGVLRDYRFPVEIESERTYEMVLTTAKIETIIKEEVRQQYLLFQLDPPNAILEVDDKLWSVEADGTAMQYVDFGTYSYRVRAKDYNPEVGKVTVDDPNETIFVPVKLKSNLTEVTLTVDADAEIWVNNQKKGVRSWTGRLGNGAYKIECKQEGHETTMVSKEITMEMSGETITLPAPTPIYGSLMVESTPNLCKLYIDGKDYGSTPKSINNILVGQHEIRLTKDGYDEHKETVTVAKGERKQVKATLNKQEVQQSIATITSSSEEQTFTVNGVSFTMKFVEGGTFQMGSNDSDADSDEKPVHSVTLSNYYIGETEVTQTLWKAVMGSNPSYFKGDNLPVENVSWNDCQEFIRKLNQKTGKNFRLPTEAEWEYAARGKTQTSLYNGENINIIGRNNSPNLDKLAWYGGNCGRDYTSVAGCDVSNGYDISGWSEKQYNDSKGGTHPVGKKQPNAYGLYDMLGNVWEWCSDWYGSDYYGKSPSSNPQGPSSGSDRVLRGGGWGFNARYCRVSDRSSGGPGDWARSFGFRLVFPQ